MPAIAAAMCSVTSHVLSGGIDIICLGLPGNTPTSWSQGKREAGTVAQHNNAGRLTDMPPQAVERQATTDLYQYH